MRQSGVVSNDFVDTNYLGNKYKGKVSLDKSISEFDCTVVPSLRGKYKVNIQWKGNHI